MPNTFDRIIQESFHGPTVSLIRKILGLGDCTIERLPRKMQRTIEREIDMLYRIALPDGGERIVHIEWQAVNDGNMCERMLLYHAMILNSYKIPVTGVVIYIGNTKMSLPHELRS